MCVITTVTDACTETREGEIGGGPAGIHIVPALFNVGLIHLLPFTEGNTEVAHSVIKAINLALATLVE